MPGAKSTIVPPDQVGWSPRAADHEGSQCRAAARRLGRPGDVRASESTMGSDDDDLLVRGYLSAVTAALDERGIAVTDEQHPETLSGTLALHPSTVCVGFGWGPTQVSWHHDIGWSIQFYGGINGHVTTRRYLPTEPVPSPGEVARFIAAVAAGRDIGASAPPRFACSRKELVTQLDRFRTGDTRHDGPATGVHDEEATNARPLPVQLPQQRQANLAKATRARAARKKLREQITRGEVSIAAVLDRVGADPVVAKTRVADLLKALPGYGTVTVAALLSDIGIHPDRRVGGLGRRQRQALLDAITPGSPMADR
jgi:S13-like protein/uncharacterized protein DUF6292